MIKIKKATYVFIIMMILIVLILNTFITRPVYAVRAIANDFSNLVNYPSIYTLVRELQVAHPTWNFTMLYTGLNWDDVIYNETVALHSRSLVQNSVITGNINDWLCPICYTTLYDNLSWYCASAKTASYYIDPRNWIDEETIFSMESLAYDPSIQNIEGVRKILAGTFMEKEQIEYIDTTGNVQIIYKSYAQIFMEAGQAFNVNPYALASRVKQEQGAGGSSLISGKYPAENPEYIGYYNYFNIGASGDGSDTIIRNGLTKAQKEGWTNPELAIHGGAQFMAGNYISRKQDTGYLQKYALDPEGILYSYQYMQNVSAPYTEGRATRKGYIESGQLENEFNFIIPVFENMPEMASPRPGRTISLVTDNVTVTTQSSPLSIRSGPSTSYNVIARADKGSTLLRIEKAEDTVDGIYWDKVIYSMGGSLGIGYATREYLGDVATAQTVNEAKITTEMCNLRNGPGTTESRVKRVLPGGTPLTVIDKMNVAVDGHIWYRVMLQDGTQGYVSSAFLQDGVVEKYKIDGTYVKIIPGTVITDIPGAVLNGDVLGTGASITIDGVEYILSVKGDTNGDGKIDSADLLKIVRHLNGTSLIAVESAGDTNGDGKIDSADLAKLVRYLNNTTTLNIN